MSYIMSDLKCLDCEHEEERLLHRSELAEEKFECSQCGSKSSIRRLSAPTILNASYVDGTKRPGFADLKALTDVQLKGINGDKKEKSEANKEYSARVNWTPKGR